jgi:hypothetical protein
MPLDFTFDFMQNKPDVIVATNILNWYKTKTCALHTQINNRNVDIIKHGLQSVPDNCKVNRDRLFNKIGLREGTRRWFTL